MRAAKNLTLGPKKGKGVADRVRLMAGDEIPEDLLDQVPDELILEKVAKKDPGSLTREQLMELAGLAEPKSDGDENSSEEEEDEFDEEEFREGLSQFDTKRALAEWAEEVFGIELDTDDTRDQMEDELVAYVSGESDEDEDDEE